MLKFLATTENISQSVISRSLTLRDIKIRDFRVKFLFSKFRMEPVMLSFLAPTENRKHKKEKNQNDRLTIAGKCLNRTAGNCYSQFPDIK